MNIIPIKSYSNLEKYKDTILKDNKGKSGIYRWNNLITKKSYVGSAICLSKRLRDYFSPKALKRLLMGRSSYIYRAILKYDYFNFNLEILE